MNFKKQFNEGLLTKNPVTVQLLGMCSTLAITTSLFNGIGMGLAVTIITICSNVLISALRKVIPNQIRIAAYITIIAGFVTVVDLLLQAFIPALSAALGVFIPLIVVNCIILGRAEAFANKNPVIASAVDGLGMGIGFTAALFLMGAVREIFGALKDYEDVLLTRPEFMRVHRSYIVNMLQVAELSPAGIRTFSGKLIPVSRQLYPQLQKEYMNLLFAHREC